MAVTSTAVVVLANAFCCKRGCGNISTPVLTREVHILYKICILDEFSTIPSLIICFNDSGLADGHVSIFGNCLLVLQVVPYPLAYLASCNLSFKTQLSSRVCGYSSTDHLKLDFMKTENVMRRRTRL